MGDGSSVEPLEIEDVLLLKPRVHRDSRGSFREVFRLSDFESLTGIEREWPQANHSISRRGVLRGIHYQVSPLQGKIVTCLSGTVYDVAVDLRDGSTSFGRWVSTILSEANGHQLWIPEGFGHAFLTLSSTADVSYMLTSEFFPTGYRSIAWNDPDIAIDWPLTGDPELSETDIQAPGLSTVEVM